MTNHGIQALASRLKLMAATTRLRRPLGDQPQEIEEGEAACDFADACEELALGLEGAAGVRFLEAIRRKRSRVRRLPTNVDETIT